MKMKTTLAALTASFLIALWFPAIAREAMTSEKHAFTVETVASGLNHPWSLVFLPDGDILVSERNGGLKRISTNGDKTAVQGLPEGLVYRGQGGLLGLALSPDFVQSKRIYLAFAEEGKFGKSGTAVASAILSGNQLSNITTIFSQTPKLAGGRHYGGRLLTTDKHLYIALGDRGNRDKAQQNNAHVGTLVRLNLDGSVPNDNPFVSDKNTLPEIYAYGHRNIQGMTLDNDGQTLWTHEHGPQGGDELNMVTAGANYGWPTITYGVNYGTGSQIGIGTELVGMEQPVHYWVPSIAPSGMEMISGQQFHHWQGDMLLGSLKFGLLVRLDMENGKVIAEERLLDNQYGRIRDVVESPDGDIFLLTDSSNGELLRLTVEK
ncbi:PQQ-dependent sugar dehydrogenase [Grimontia hollisae]|uniref:Soluble aldose sugar dehydrogenase yliI n=1 Tax=Grimontia hollisae TaxID=673 RepID=A0A377J9W1_GRIHO|nr:PQQ-dependent sugar dehydrogenase [Grimontia hollisae]MDF2184020.1 PQQ-dependent sugar dehydrogenase [Grimontia hollisae]STO98563.1 Soluble aldose sugar dehydrogenase yliI precursor [Grimontia hollisae]